MSDKRPADDQAIPNDEKLYIRIVPSDDVLVPIGNGEFRPMSGAVKRRDKDEPLSVDRASLSTPDRKSVV